MRCFTCEKLSIDAICKDCQKEFLNVKLIKREVGNLEVISFFDFSDIEEIARSKYLQAGRRVYKYLAKKYFKEFLDEYSNSIDDTIYLLGVDENVTRGYSNIAVLTEYASRKNKKIKPLHGAMLATKKVKYAGKSLEYRLDNPKEFIYNGPKNIEVILIDDTITTGTTLEQAVRVLKESGVEPLFAITLSSVADGVDDY